MILFAIIIFALYILFLIMVLIGWQTSRTHSFPSSQRHSNISVLIPVRNEEQNIAHVIRDIVDQNYGAFEIIIIDDHSDDTTAAIVKSMNDNRIRLIHNPGHGKKSAISQGVNHAKGDIIVTTDADCRVGVNWLSGINAMFADNQTMMVTGPVTIMDGNFFSKMQQIEFASLIGTAAAMIKFRQPVMCNGANLAYRRHVFHQVDGYSGNDNVPSGDDEFLMRKIYSVYPKGIKFLKDQAAIVKTEPQADIKNFFIQRIRWASKWKYNRSLFARTLAIFIASLQITTLVAITAALFGDISFLILFVTKVFVEGFLLVLICQFLQIRWNLLAFIILQIIYPIYVVAVGIASQFVSYTWKGRRLNFTNSLSRS